MIRSIIACDIITFVKHISQIWKAEDDKTLLLLLLRKHCGKIIYHT